MARPQTAAQIAANAAVRRVEFFRVFVQNPDGVMTDLTALSGKNWCLSADLDWDIDQPIVQATVRLRRDAGATLSLAPTRTDSTLNRNAAAAYAPFLDVSRAIYIDVAVLDPAVATTPIAADWQRLFHGTIDSVDPASDQVVLVARDLGARLADAWLTERTALVVDGGPTLTIEQCIQAMLDTALGAGAVTLYTPVSPVYVVTVWGYQREPLMDAVQRLAQSIGWDCRYLWDAGTSTFRLTLANPPRTKTTPDFTLGPSRYKSITKYAIARASVRNRVRIYYTSGTSRVWVELEDTTSIARYGVRPIIIEEAGDSAISSEAEAIAMAGALLADLKAPRADQEAGVPLLWPVELNDLIRFSANGVHYDTDTDLAVVGIRRSLVSSGMSMDTLTLRGNPAGAYRAWIKRGAPIVGGERAALAPSLDDIRRLDSETETTIYFTPVGAVSEVWAAYKIVTAPEVAADWQAVAAAVSPLAVGATSFTVPRPADGKVVLVQLEPRRPDLTPGSVRRLAITATPQVPTVELDDAETNTVGTQWISLLDRGIAVSSVVAQTQIGTNPISGYTTPTRGPGATSTVKGGVLGAGQYEQDVTLDANRQSWVVFKYTLANGSVLVLNPFGFDRDKNPNLGPVTPSGTIVSIVGDVDTKSVKLASTTRPWNRSVDGTFGSFDIATADASGNAGLGAGLLDTFTASAQSDPIAYVGAGTLKDSRDVVVGNGAAAPAASWLTVSGAAPASGDAVVAITLHASAAPAGWNVKVYIAESLTSTNPTPTVDETANLTPALSAPPTTSTVYSFTSDYIKTNNSAGAQLVTFRFKAVLRDATNVVKDTRTVTVSWYTGGAI